MDSNSSSQFLLNLLIKCLSNKNDIRNSAESSIKSITSSNYESVLLNCAGFLTDENIQIEVRQLCASIIKNFLSLPSNDKKWSELSQEKKTFIKNNVLSCLGSSAKEIRRAGASAVAAIARLEMPSEEWPSLLPTLEQAADSPTINFKLSIVTTIGYLCQEIQPEAFSPSDKETMFKIIFTYIYNCEDQELLYQTLNALLRYIYFLDGKMKEDQFKTAIYNQLISYAGEGYKGNIRIISLQCMTELSRAYYDVIENQMNSLVASFICSLMGVNDEKIGVQAFFFWVTLCEEEMQRITYKKQYNHYCQSAIGKIWNEIQSILLSPNQLYSKDNEDDFTRYNACSYLLEILAKTLDKNFLGLVFNFMNQCFKTSDIPKHRSAIYAFTSILEAKEKQQIVDVIPFSIPHLVSYLDSPDEYLQLMVAWCIEKLCEIHYDIFYTKTELFDAVILLIIKKINQVTLKITVRLCYAIHFLAINTKVSTENSSRIFSNYLQTLLQILITLAYSKNSYNPNYNVSSSSFIAIGSLIEISNEDDREIVQNFFATIYEAFSNSLNIDNFINENMQYDFQSYLANVLVSYIATEKIPMTLSQATALYGLIKQSFVQRNTVYEDGLIACSSIAYILGDSFNPILEDFFKYLLFAIQNWKDVSMCSNGLVAMDDIVRGAGRTLLPYIDQLMEEIMKIVKEDTDNKLKLQVILVFSDLITKLPDNIWGYYQSIMLYIKNAIEASMMPNDFNDVDLCEYLNTLRERLLEFITCLLYIIKENKKDKVFEGYIELVMNFINTINQEDYRPNDYITKESAGIICDLCGIYRMKIEEYINDNCVKFILKNLKNSSDKEGKQLIEPLMQFVLMLRINKKDIS